MTSWASYDGKDKGTDTTPLFFRYDYFDEARQPAPRDRSAGITIRIKDPAQAAEVAKRVDAEFENSPAETKTEPEGAFIQGWANQIGNIVFIVAAILGAVFFTILLVTGNTMAQAVRERTGELGVLKAIGFTNGRIVALVLAESCLLAVIGGAVGLGLACAVIPVMAEATGRPAAVVFSARAGVHRTWPRRGAGSGHRNFSRAPGHAPARGGRLEENVK